MYSSNLTKIKMLSKKIYMQLTLRIMVIYTNMGHLTYGPSCEQKNILLLHHLGLKLIKMKPLKPEKLQTILKNYFVL